MIRPIFTNSLITDTPKINSPKQNLTFGANKIDFAENVLDIFVNSFIGTPAQKADAIKEIKNGLLEISKKYAEQLKALGKVLKDGEIVISEPVVHNKFSESSFAFVAERNGIKVPQLVEKNNRLALEYAEQLPEYILEGAKKITSRLSSQNFISDLF